MKTKSEKQNKPEMLSDHRVLEFVNTKPMIDGRLEDLLRSDADVLKLLASLGWRAKFGGVGLVDAARGLREELRHLLESRKAGKPLAVGRLNEFLSQARSYLELTRGEKGAYALHRVWEDETPQQTLAPLAEAAAELLATGDFELIRRCESESCVLWFYDRTKSHHRRWCSMASCGNRHKVAAFRSRRSKA